MTNTAYPVTLPLRYESKKGKGKGQSLLLSRQEVYFTPSGTLTMWEKVTIWLDWPVLLNDKVALQLVLGGVVQHVGDTTATVSIRTYEFRTKRVCRLVVA